MARVLVVDDDADILDCLEIALHDAHQVLLARNGLEALAILDREDVDVVLLDLMMPVLDGAGFMRGLAERARRPPVILVSAARDLERRVAELGALDHATKPFDLTALEDKIARAAFLARAPA